MKNFTLRFNLFFILTFILSLSLNAQINPNGGFEEGTPGIHSGSDVTGWAFETGGVSRATFEIVDNVEDVHSGSQALKVTVDTVGSNTWEPQIFNTDFQITSNTTYTATVWAKTDSAGAQITVTAGSLSPNYHEWNRKTAALSVNWQQITLQFKTRNPESEPRAGIPIHFGATNNKKYLPFTVYLDDLEVTAPSSDVAGQSTAIPGEYSLSQNYPNPFNPSSTITFDIPEQKNVRIVLVNALGEIVKEVVNQSYNAGTYSVTINGINLPSGVYFYRMEAGLFTATKKLLLLK